VPVDPAIRTTHEVPRILRMRVFDRDLIRGGHYGQRSCEPRKQAEHMAAPTKLQACRKPLPTGSRPHMALFRHPVVGNGMSAFGLEAEVLETS